MPIETVDPRTGERVRSFAELTPNDIEVHLQRAEHAATRWRALPLDARTAVVRRAGDILERDRERFGALMTLEMGKPIQAAIDEAVKCATCCRWYADNAARILTPEPIDMDGEEARVEFHPLGVVLAVMPWNFPFWQVIRFAAPALCAGNVGLLKHASNVPQCAVAIADLFREAGAPDGVFQTLLVGSRAVQGILADPRVAAATLTGSEHAGSQVAATAGKHIKKTVLELGGSDPFIVMPSADLDAAVSTAVKARTINNGQSCIAAKRFIVHERIAAEFERRFVAGMRALVVGDPMDRKTQIGPLAMAQIRNDLDEQVRRSVEMGARVALAGGPRQGPGFYYDPVVLAEIPDGAPAHREELFGPVATLWTARDADDAIRIANDSPFGLGSAAWTRDRGEAERFAAGIEAGSVFINGMVASDPRAPFGGVKISGYGRELGAWGMREFLNVKTVRMKWERGAERKATE